MSDRTKRNKRGPFDFLYSVLILLLFVSTVSAYTINMGSDQGFYSQNETIKVFGNVKDGNLSVANATLSLTAGSYSNTSVITAANGSFYVEFNLSQMNGYNMTITDSTGASTKHGVEVVDYADITMTTDKTFYAAGENGTLTVSMEDINEKGVSGKSINAKLLYSNGSVYANSLTIINGTTTDSSGELKLNFTTPTAEGEYILEINGKKEEIALKVGGWDSSMKLGSYTIGPSGNIEITGILKTAAGSGTPASSVQAEITNPSGAATTVSLVQYYDSSGTAITGAYNYTFNQTSTEGEYKVKLTLSKEGSNDTKTLYGNFQVKSYSIDVIPWEGKSSYYPGETVELEVKFRNASDDSFLGGKAQIITSATKIYNPNGAEMSIVPTVTELTTSSAYKMSFTAPSANGRYAVKISANSSGMTGTANGDFRIKAAKSSVAIMGDDGLSKSEFLSGKRMFVNFRAKNNTGSVNVSSISSYKITDDKGNDRTSAFTEINKTEGNLTLVTPKLGGVYIIKAIISTGVGDIEADTQFRVKMYSASSRAAKTNSNNYGSGGSGMMQGGGPGYMFYYKPNESVVLNITVTSATEKQGMTGMMGGMGMNEGPGAGAAMGTKMEFGGMFGLGGSSKITGAKLTVKKILNVGTDEDVTSTVTITSGVTGTDGTSAVTLKPTSNGGKWNGGYYIVFFDIEGAKGEFDTGMGFFEIRNYYVNTWSKSGNISSTTTGNFMGFQSWMVGPGDWINISVNVWDPSSWSGYTGISGTARLLGVYYAGSPGEFVFPPRLVVGTNGSEAIVTNGQASFLVGPPTAYNSGKWKTGQYQIKVLFNTSDGTTNFKDVGEGFTQVKIYDGWGQPWNVAQNTMDFTATNDENISIKIQVFDVKNSRPAQNLTVTLKDILSFASFPPASISYDVSNVKSGTTDSKGEAVITVPPPSGGWTSGEHIASFTVVDTNGTSDKVDGFFQIKPFFVEMQPASTQGSFGQRWSFGTTEIIPFDVTVSTDPSWMRRSMGSGCSPGDPMCGGSGGGSGTTSFTYIDRSECECFQGESAGLNASVVNQSCHNAVAGPGYAWAVAEPEGNAKPSDLNPSTGPSIEACSQNYPDVFKGGSTSYSSGSLNATITEVLVYRFDFTTWSETELVNGTNFNYTPAAGAQISGLSGKLNITPIGAWTAGGYRVVVKLSRNNYATTGDSGFEVQAYRVSCSKLDWKWTYQSDEKVRINCSVFNPANPNIPYVTNTTVYVSQVRNTRTSQLAISDWSTTTNIHANNTGGAVNLGTVVNLSQSLPSGMYEATLTFTDGTTAKTASEWFEVKDFDVSFWSNSWSASPSTAINFTAQGHPAGNWWNTLLVNLSNSSAVTLYRYDSNWQPVIVDSSRYNVTAHFNANALTTGFNYTTISLKPNTPWTEGQYEARVGLKKVNASLAALPVIGNPLEMSSWFQVKLFNAWGYSRSWSSTPKDNLTLYLYVQDSNWNNYNANVNVTVQSITYDSNPLASSKYNVTNQAQLNSFNPNTVGKMEINLTPMINSAINASAQWPLGYYRVTLKITDISSGSSTNTDLWFEVRGYALSASTNRYTYQGTDDVNVTMRGYTQSGGAVTLKNVTITNIQKCTASGCSNVVVAEPSNYSYNDQNNLMTIKGVSPLTATGGYSVTFQSESVDGTTAATTAGFEKKGFYISGNVVNPQNRWQYYINETINVSITAPLGANVTRAIITYWVCNSSSQRSTEYNLTVYANYTSFANNITQSPQPIYFNPVGGNNTWVIPIETSGYIGYNMRIYAASPDGASEESLYTYASIYWPWTSLYNNQYNVYPSDSMNFTINTYLDDAHAVPLPSVNISIYEIRVMKTSSDWPGTLVNATALLNSVSPTFLTNTSGYANLIISPNSTGWPEGELNVNLKLSYGNATARPSTTMRVGSPTLWMWVDVKNHSNGVNLMNYTTWTATAPVNKTINLTLNVMNPTKVATDVNVTFTPTSVYIINKTGSSAAIRFSQVKLGVPAGSGGGMGGQLNSTVWQINVTKKGNYTVYFDSKPNNTLVSASSIPFTFTIV